MATHWRERPIGIVGLGLIGGSLGLDLQAQGLEVRALVHRQSTAERARERGLAQQIDTSPAVLQDCALVILALPLDRLLDPDPALVAALPADAVITDVGSVKQPIQECWDRLHGRFVPSHPMAGTAHSGVEAGLTGLFQGRPWVATPTAQTDPAALTAIRELAETAGAHWLECPAAAHDQAVALISHMPVLVSAALLQSADQGGRAAQAGNLVRALASSGFADTSRIGGGNPELGTLMARTNRAAVLAALEQYQRQLQQLQALVDGEEWETLQQQLTHCQTLRPEFL